MKCLHQTGEFQEYSAAIHSRVVENGSLNPNSFENKMGNITQYAYKCWGCKKVWQYPAPTSRTIPQWLRRLHLQAFSPEAEKIADRF